MIIAPTKVGGVVITSIGHHNIRDKLKYNTDNALRVQPLYTCITFTLSPLYTALPHVSSLSFRGRLVLSLLLHNVDTSQYTLFIPLHQCRSILNPLRWTHVMGITDYKKIYKWSK